MAKADVKIFAGNLRYLMNQRDLGTKELATELFIAPPRVKAWLEAKCFPKESLLIQLCEYFDYYDIFKLLTQKLSKNETD
jgi:transcriptional regulator with XRE-family HTH domain